MFPALLQSFPKSFRLKLWIVGQGLAEVSFINFVKVLRYLFCFRIYLVKKHVMCLSDSGAFNCLLLLLPQIFIWRLKRVLIKEHRTPVSSTCRGVSVKHMYFIDILNTCPYYGVSCPQTLSGVTLQLPQVAVTRGQGRAANVSQQEDGLNLPLGSNMKGQHECVLL